jgi:hypothetical protein
MKLIGYIAVILIVLWLISQYKRRAGEHPTQQYQVGGCCIPSGTTPGCATSGDSFCGCQPSIGAGVPEKNTAAFIPCPTSNFCTPANLPPPLSLSTSFRSAPMTYSKAIAL